MARIMVQGTTSSAGKSLMVTGLCRIFKNRGLKVYPFKSQNMSRNSYTTIDGKYVSTAQALQAFAAGIEPEAKMNPVLLIPETDMGSKVVLDGVVYKHMYAREYFEFKNSLKDKIKNTFDEIEKNSDLVVIEGAGSPAEINLKENDIVNMGLAKMVDAPVILVADIDRGGVFASLYGTVMLLEPDERARIKGLIINKFRGDKELLMPGVDMIEQLTGIPVIGVVPFMRLDIPDEDSLKDYDKASNHKEFVSEELDREFDKLAELMEKNLDMKAVEKIIYE